MSAGVTGRMLGYAPVLSDSPTTWPPRMPPPAKDHRVALRPVIAAGVFVDHRRAAEIAHPDHQRAVQQAALGQVVEQCRVRLLHRRHETVLELLEVVLVRVPGDARAVDRGDEPHARLDQPPRQQVRLAPRVPAVALADLRRLLRQIECSPGCLRRHQRQCLRLVRRRESRTASLRNAKMALVQCRQQAPPLGKPLGRHAVDQPQVRARGSSASWGRR